MKKLIVVALVMVIAILTMVGCVSVRAESDLKTPLEWAKEEIASDERYEGKHVMFSVIPVEDSTLGKNEALYFIIAITEDSDLVMDWYGVHLEWEEYKLTFKDRLSKIYSTKPIIERFSRDQVYIDADLAKTEVIEE
jgi:hypothetical protein